MSLLLFSLNRFCKSLSSTFFMMAENDTSLCVQLFHEVNAVTASLEHWKRSMSVSVSIFYFSSAKQAYYTSENLGNWFNSILFFTDNDMTIVINWSFYTYYNNEVEKWRKRFCTIHVVCTINTVIDVSIKISCSALKQF